MKLGGKVDSIIALSDQGELYGWGCNEYAQLLANSDSENIYKALRLSNAMAALDAKAIDVDCGGSFAIALTEKKSVFVWGYGILGTIFFFFKFSFGTDILDCFLLQMQLI